MKNSYLRIREFCEVFDGPHATPGKTEEGPFYLSISSLENGKLDLNKSAHLSENDFKKWTKRVTPRQGDLLFSYETRLGEAALMPDGIRACLGRRMGILRPEPAKVLPEFLLYSYIAPEFQNVIVANTITGATVDRISLTDLPNFVMRLPPLDEQRRIVSVLTTLDAKIELNQRINAELEGMAKLLYDYWFVQFDFPMSAAQAAALGKPHLNGHPYRASGGQMIYNQTLKRDIPQGWEVKALDDICQSVRDSVDPANVDPATPYVGLEHVPRRQFFLDAWDPASSVKSLKSRFIKGDVLFGKLRPYFHKVVRVDMEGICTSELLVLRSRHPKYEALLGSVVFSDQFVESTSKQWGGAQMPRADWNRMKKFQLPVPSDELLKDFNAFVLPLWKLGGSNQQQNQELTRLRDWLLPMLMNGQVTVG